VNSKRSKEENEVIPKLNFFVCLFWGSLCFIWVWSHFLDNLKSLGYKMTFHTTDILHKYDHGYVPLVVNTSLSFPHSWLITRFVTRLTRQVPLLEQELLALQEHLSSPPVFSGVRVTRYLALCVCYVDRCLSIYTFSFGHCVVCSSIYGFYIPFWYLQTLLHTIVFCTTGIKKIPQCKCKLKNVHWWVSKSGWVIVV